MVKRLQPVSTPSDPIPVSYLNDEDIRSVTARDIPVRGLRQARHAKCGRELLTTGITLSI